jgi:hypothetical protein
MTPLRQPAGAGQDDLDEPRDPWERRPRVWGDDLAEVTIDGMPISRPPRDEDRLKRHGGNGQPGVRVMADDGSILAATTWYQRVTRFIKVIDENVNLQMWEERMLCRGILARHEEFLDDIAANQEDRNGLNGVIARAKEAGGRNVASTRGKALHFMLERADLTALGQAEMPPIVPSWMEADIHARLEQTRYFRMLHVEKPMISDRLRVLGTPDRVFSWRPCPNCGRTEYIGDDKTGRVDEYTELQQCMQLGIYANADYYNVDSGERTPQDTICRCRAAIFHTPYGSGVSRLEWVDILAPRVWAARKKKDPDDPDGNTPLGALLVPFVAEPDVEWLISTCSSLEDLQAVERAHRQYWTETTAALALARSQTF